MLEPHTTHPSISFIQKKNIQKKKYKEKKFFCKQQKQEKKIIKNIYIYIFKK